MEFIVIIIIVIAIIIRTIYNSPEAKGIRGEARVERTLYGLPKDEYKFINDITIPNPKSRTGTSQIDHIVLSEYGIFVIETKNWSGWIFGSSKQRKWTIVHRKYHRLTRSWGSQKFYNQNPINQNWGHILALVDYVNIPKHYFYNLVCLTGNAEFKTEVPDECFSPREMRKHILTYQEKRLSKKLLESVSQKLQPKPKPKPEVIDF